MAIIKENREPIHYGTLIIYKNAEGIDLKWVNDHEKGKDAWVITDKGLSFTNRSIIEQLEIKQEEAKSLEVESEVNEVENVSEG